MAGASTAAITAAGVASLLAGYCLVLWLGLEKLGEMLEGIRAPHQSSVAVIGLI